MSEQMSGIRIDALTVEDAAACQGMTFPAYRHLLTLAPALRHPDEGDQRMVRAVGKVAREDDRIVGLALAEIPVAPDPNPPELLSVFVAPACRRRGIATALLAEVEDALARLGFDAVDAVYMTGRASQDAVERLLAKRGWTRPELRTVSVRFTPQEAMATPWFGRIGIPTGAEIVAWTDITPAERQRLIASNEAAPWIPHGLQPWRHDRIGFDPVSSVGLRYRGEVVGWVINHRVAPDTVRFTCSFVRRDLSRRARILPLYSEAIRRLAATDCRFCTFVTPTTYPEMVGFIMRHCKPFITYTGETRGSRKHLRPSP